MIGDCKNVDYGSVIVHFLFCLNCTVCILYLCRADNVLHWCANFFQNAVFCSYEQVSVVEAVKKSVYPNRNSSMCKSHRAACSII